MDRTGTGTRSLFGAQYRYDLREGFPLVTTKKIHMKSVLYELLWFIKGDSNVGFLQDNGVRIWNEWADENGDLGPVYGVQWRSWPAPNGDKVDQLAKLVEDIKVNPYSRRHILSAWNVGMLDQMALPPCHLLFQFYVKDNELSLMLYQRSADLFLGVPFNIASYSALLMMVAKLTDLKPTEFIHTIGDAHIYDNHLDGVRTQLQREHKALPELKIHGDQKTIDDFRYEDFELMGYDPHPHIPGKVAV